MRRLIWPVAIAAWPQAALAHAPVEGFDGFAGGLLHPITVPAHTAALVGLGLLIARQPAGSRILSLVSFGLALAGGLAAIGLAVGESAADHVVSFVTLICGFWVASAAAVRPSLARLLLAALAAIGGAAIGLDSPPDTTSIPDAINMLIGTAIGAWLGLALAIVLASRARRDWQRVALRVIGSWLAASAILALALAFAT
jgi:urease accessory protein